MNLSIIGAGSWGTALAQVLSYNFKNVFLWDIDIQVLKSIGDYHKNEKYHPNIMLAHNIIPENDIQQVFDNADIVIVAIPTQYIRQTLKNIKIKKEKPLVSASKGIEINSLKLVSNIIQESLNLDSKYIFALSGPSFAKEVIMGLPTAIVLAGDLGIGKDLQKLFSTKTFRVYLSDDIVGAEVGGAMKNVIAIASGISDGLGLGNNARASLITRGLYEMSKIASFYGGKPQTVYGLSGLGDLILTATGDLSRNRKFGLLIGKRYDIEDAIKEICQVVEGYTTAKAVYDLSQKYNIDLPISNMVYKVLYEKLDPKTAAEILMLRDLKTEF